jgi:ABC-type lipoprotein export system ATPase subunit
VYAELHRKLAAGRDAISGTQIACVYQRAELIAQLDVQRNVTFRL